MTDSETWRPFSELSPEEQQAFLASVGEPQRQYDPIHPRDNDWRGILGKIWAPILAVLGIALKFGFILFKFFGIFISVGAYTLIWGWRFAVGFVLLLLVHELGHFVEARRQGLDVSLPRFVPFLGAYVLIRNAPFHPWRNTLVALAGPIAGGLGALACYGAGAAIDSNLLRALGYSGFLLNLFNLLPLGILDGGAVRRSWKAGKLTGDAGRIASLALTVAGLLVVGLVATHVPQHRL